MALTHQDWTVLEHGPLTPLATNLRWVSGALPHMSLRRTMLVARRADGGLVVHNPIALAPAAQAELDAMGPVRAIIVPNGMHRLDAPAYAARYPDARVYAPRGSRRRVEEAVRVDGELADYPADDVVWFEPLAGMADAEGVMLVRSDDGVTVTLTDAVFNMDKKRDLLGRVITTILGSAPGPRVSRLAKAMLIKDQAALRANLLRLAELPDLVRLVVAHEKVAHGPAAAAALWQASGFLAR